MDLSQLFGTGLQGLLSDTEQQQVGSNALLNSGLAMLAASQGGQPGGGRVGLGSVLSQGLQAGTGAYQQGLQNTLTNRAYQKQLEQQKNRQDILQMFNQNPAQMALMNGKGPTMDNAEAMKTTDMKSVYANAIDMAVAKGDFELADTLDKAAKRKFKEFETQSVQEIMLNGKPVKVAIGKDGTTRELGVAPEDLIQVDVGGQKLLVGKTTGKQLGQYNVTMTPAERDASAVRWQTLNQGNFEYVQPTKDGGPAGVFNKKTGKFEATGTAAPKDVQTLQNASNAIVEAANLIPKSTGSGIGAVADIAAGAFGAGTEGAKSIAQLNVLGAKLVGNVPRFEGPQSNADVNLYKQAAGDVANPYKPRSVRLEALKTVANLIAKDAQVKGIPIPPELNSFMTGTTQQAPKQQSKTLVFNPATGRLE